MSPASSLSLSAERTLVEAAALLIERARKEMEREVQEADESAAAALRGDLQRARDLETRLHVLRDLWPDSGALTASQGRQVSRYYDAPGQEDG